MATYMGIPVSTTHTITGAIVGVGAARRVSAVRWNVAKDIVVAWVLTMPAAGLIGAGFFFWRGVGMHEMTDGSPDLGQPVGRWRRCAGARAHAGSAAGHLASHPPLDPSQGLAGDG